MIESKLFLGFAVDSDFAKALQAVSAERLSFFIQNNDAHLQEVVF